MNNNAKTESYIDEYLKNLRITIGEQIRTAREEKGWSQGKLAEECKLSESSRTTIAKWENGTKAPNYNQLEDLCKAFSCEMSYLFGDDLKTRDRQFIHDKTGLTEQALINLYEIYEKKDTVLGSAKLILINAILEDSTFLDRAANLLYALHMIPQKSIVAVSFFTENHEYSSCLLSDSSDDLRRLYMADLQNIIFSFLVSQFQK